MTLHDRIRAVVEERLRIAREATPGPWLASGNADGQNFVTTDALSIEVCTHDGSWYMQLTRQEIDARHIAANDPADAILSAEHALGILERHRAETFAGSSLPEHLDLDPDESWCRVCRGSGWPCPDIRDLATRWRVEVDG